MSDQPGPTGPSLDATEFSRSMAEIAETSQKLVADFLTRQAAEGLGPSDPLNIGGAFMEMTTRMMNSQVRLTVNWRPFAFSRIFPFLIGFRRISSIATS